MLSGTVAALALAIGAPGVDFRADAIPASKVLAELQAKHGVRLRVVAPLDAEPLIINVSDVKLDDLLAQIAYVTDGKWSVGADGTRTLKPDGVVRKPLQAFSQRFEARRREVAHFLKREDALGTNRAEEFLAAVRRLIANPPQSNAALANRLAELGERTPEALFWKRVSLAIDLQGAREAISKRVLFSTRDEPGIRKLNRAALDAARTMFREKFELAAIVERSPLTEAERRFLRNAGSSLGDFLVRLESNAHDALRNETVDHVDVEAAIPPGGSGSIFAALISESGGRVAKFYTIRPGLLVDVPPPSVETATFLAKVRAGAGRKVTSDEVNRLIAVYANQFGLRTPPLVIDEAAIPRLMKPEQFDPFRLCAVPALHAAHDEYGKDVVACLPDVAFAYTITLLAGERPTVGRFLRRMATPEASVETRVRGEWLTLKNNHEMPESRVRVDRQAFAERLARLRNRSELTLADAEWLAVPEGTRLIQPSLHTVYLRAVAPWAERFAIPHSRAGAALWTRLSPDQQALALGQGLPVRGLPASQQALVRAAIAESNVVRSMKDPRQSVDFSLPGQIGDRPARRALRGFGPQATLRATRTIARGLYVYSPHETFRGNFFEDEARLRAAIANAGARGVDAESAIGWTQPMETAVVQLELRYDADAYTPMNFVEAITRGEIARRPRDLPPEWRGQTQVGLFGSGGLIAASTFRLLQTVE